MLTIDVLANTSKWRHKHPAEKVIPALALLVVVITRPVFPTALAALTMASAGAIFGAGVPWRRWVGTLTWPAGFVASSALSIALVGGDGPGPLPLTMTESSATLAGETLLRSLAGISVVLFIGCSTPMVDLIRLLRKARVPLAVTELMTSMYRLMFDLIDLGRTLRGSQAARLGTVGFRRSLRSVSLVVSAVFVRSMHRAKRLHVGLESRGYDGSLAVLSNGNELQPVNLVAGLGLVVAIVALSFGITVS